jgi:hypothetical protein
MYHTTGHGNMGHDTFKVKKIRLLLPHFIPVLTLIHSPLISIYMKMQAAHIRARSTCTEKSYFIPLRKYLSNVSVICDLL